MNKKSLFQNKLFCQRSLEIECTVPLRIASLFGIVLLVIMCLPVLVIAQNEMSPLEQSFSYLENEFGVNVSYNVDLLHSAKRSQKISINGLSLEGSLLKLLRHTAWEFEVLSDKYVVIKEATPAFYTTYSKNICGIIREDSSLEVLPFASIKLFHSTIGCSAEGEGRFELYAPLVANDSLEISYLGYQSVVIPVAYFEGSSCPTVKLKIASNALAQVIVEENRREAMFLTSEEGSERQFSLQTLDLLGGQVEKDVFQALALLPGITSSNESASSFHIRGGGQGQNLVLYDGMTLYHFGHFFGKVSAVNPTFSDNVSLFTEGIDARYGGRVAGVVDIKSRDEIPEKMTLEANINTLSGNFTMHTPLFKQKGHLLVAYRRSYSDRIENGYFKKVFDQIFQNSRIIKDENYLLEDSIVEISSLIPITSFSDFNAKIAWQLGDKNQMSFSFIDIKDDLFYDYKEGDWYESVDTLGIHNSGYNFSWKHDWHDQSHLLLDVSYSHFDSRYFFLSNLVDTVIDTHYGTLNQIDDYSFKLSNIWETDGQTLHSGIQYNVINEGHETFLIAPWENPNYFWRDTTQGQTIAGFVDYHYDIPKKVHLNVGLRASYYDLTEDYYLEPRFHVSIYPSPDWILKVSSGVYYQTINEIIEYNELNSDAGLWVLARKSDDDEQIYFSVVKNTQFSLGVERTFNDWKMTAGLYQKLLTGITSRSLQFGDEFPWVNGNMEARGLEWSLQKNTDRFFSIFSYTLSETNYEFDYPDYLIPASYDQRHNISWLQGYYWKDFTISSTLNWHTGTPYAKGAFLVDDSIENPDDPGYWIDFEQYNGLRLPNYMRWDISLSWAFGKKRLKGKLHLAALNLLNRKNVLSRRYSLDYAGEEGDPPTLIEVNKFGIPFSPNIGCSIRF